MAEPRSLQEEEYRKAAHYWQEKWNEREKCIAELLKQNEKLQEETKCFKHLIDTNFGAMEL